MIWQTTRFDIDLDQPQVMGIVNVTPDSFAQSERQVSERTAMQQCEQLLKDGAAILDIGGESSRPGAVALPLEEELNRVLPVLKFALTLGVPVSVDTYKASVMRQALELGVDIINDIWALRQEGALTTVAAHARCGVCLMHMQGEPQSMQDAPQYADVVLEVGQFLQRRMAALSQYKIGLERVVLDPGIGFGKRVQDNVNLLARQEELGRLGRPLLVGWSRKSTLGHLTGRPVQERLPASLAAALISVTRGARVLRVHDVAATVDALRVWQAVQQPGNSVP